MQAAKVWGLWVVLALGAVLAWAGTRLPGPAPASAPAEAFSAQRAMLDVQRLAGEPHPTGSLANAAARDRLVARMDALGLKPAVREVVGLFKPKWALGELAAGTLHDVVGVLAGRDPSLPAVVLMAHYDSVPNSPGAADDAAGVAAALEIARALSASGPHLRDTLVVITDGEEEGLLGAEGFLHADPLAAHMGVVLNMEARGDAGPALMFETGEASGALTDLYARAARHPRANSVSSFIYHLLPNDTDFSPVRKLGIPGLNFAFVGDQLAYHTPLATPAHLSRESLQSLGDQVLPTARALADARVLPARTPDRVYADLFGGPVAAYAASAGWWVLLAAAALTAFAAWRAHRAGRFVAWQALRGAATTLAATTAAALALLAAGAALHTGSYVHQYHLLGRPGALFAGAILLALGFALLVVVGSRRGDGILQAWAGTLLCVLVACGFEGRLDGLAVGLGVATAVFAGLATWRPLPTWGGWIGALIIALSLATAVQAAAPVTAMLFAWPVLFGAASAAGAAALGRKGAAAAGALAGAAAVVMLAWLGVWAQMVFVLVGAATPLVLALFIPLLLPTLHPLAAAWGKGRRKRAVAFALALAGAGTLAAVELLPSPPARPDLTQAFAFSEPARGAFRRVDTLPRLDGWAKGVLEGGGRVAKAELPLLDGGRVWQAPAPAFPAPPPKIALARRGAELTLTAAPANAGRELYALLRSPVRITLTRVQGREVKVEAAAGGWLRVAYAGPPTAGVTLVAQAPGAVEVVVGEVAQGWPQGLARPARPPGRMAFGLSDHTVVVARASAPAA